MDADRNLLFGVLALQADLIDAQQFIDACLLWTSRKDVPLAELLVERGWINSEDRAHVDYLLARKLKKHGGDPRASLIGIPDDIKRSLAALPDDEIQRTLTGFYDGAILAQTIGHERGPRERYARVRLHATGGIGRVWVAHDTDLGREVALKELQSERAEHPTVRSRFLQEARITGQLEHPGVVPVYELGRRPEDKQPFYTMRFVKGRTLSEAARDFHDKRLAGQAGTLEFPVLLNAFVTVCNTVAYAHSRGVIHRDLKGQNVILGDFGEVVVLDWGLAKRIDRPESESLLVEEGSAEDSGQTVQGQALGTPAYMAPEQAAGRLDLIDRRTDVYGLGAVLYEILTGRPPFAGADTGAVLRRVQTEEPAPSRQFWPETPPALEALCLRALAKNPADRPAAAVDLAQEVQGWQEYERRKASEALRQSEELYHSLVENLPCMIVCKDLEGRFTFANHRYCEFLGLPLEQILGRTDADHFPQALAEKYRRDDQTVIDSGRVLEIVEEVQFSQAKRFCQVLKTAVRDAAGRVSGIQLIAWDITERRVAEEELRKSKERFELAVQGSQDGLWDWDLTTDEVYYSPRYKEILGYEDHELPNRPEEWINRLHPDDVERVQQELRAEAGGGDSLSWLEFRMRHKDGSYRWIRSRASVLRDSSGRVYRKAGSHEDITERRVAEEELRKSKERFELAVQGSQDGLWDWDLATDEVYYSPRYKEMLGYEETEFPNTRDEWAKRVHPDDLDRVRAELRNRFKSGEPLSWVEFRMRHKDGTYRWIHSRAYVLRDANGRVYRMAGSHEDITDRKVAEEQLLQSRQRFELAVLASQDGMWDWDVAANQVWYSPQVRAMLGYSEEEYPNRPGETEKRVHPDDREGWRKALYEHVEGSADHVQIEYRILHKNGTYRWLRSRGVALRGPDGKAYRIAGSSEDITEQKRIEVELQKTIEQLSACQEQLRKCTTC